MGNKVWIIFSHRGDYDEYKKEVYKVYTNETLAKDMCDWSNQELKNKMKELSQFIEENSCTCCYFPSEEYEEFEECEHCVASWEEEILQEQHDYTIEEFEVNND